MTGDYRYNLDNYEGTDWDYNDLRGAIIGHTIPIQHSTEHEQDIGLALIENFKYIDRHNIFCDVEFKILHLEERLLNIPTLLRGPMFIIRYDIKIPVLKFKFNW